MIFSFAPGVFPFMTNLFSSFGGSFCVYHQTVCIFFECTFHLSQDSCISQGNSFIYRKTVCISLYSISHLLQGGCKPLCGILYFLRQQFSSFSEQPLSFVWPFSILWQQCEQLLQGESVPFIIRIIPRMPKKSTTAIIAMTMIV
jgi:hypothetical protein